jgi:uncharacterized protein YbjQ (UPF0145 family)
MIVTTTNDVAGQKVTKYLGVVRGITVRSRSIVGNVGAALQSIVGGNISLYTSLCERARGEAFDLMVAHGQEIGAMPSLRCVMTRTRWRPALPRCWPMALRWC